MIVNILGCFALGLVVQLPSSASWNPEVRVAVTAGFLGGFTTYSSFNQETLSLFAAGSTGPALLNVAVTLSGGFAAGWLESSRRANRGIVPAMRRFGYTSRCLMCPIAVVGAQSKHPTPGEQAQTHQDSWRQWGGPNRNFIVNSTGLADKWAETGPPVLWTRPLGTGHSAILVDDGRLFTMYRAGNGRAKQGPWEAEETVIAMDAATGKTLWEHTYPSRREDFSFGAGPHSTPLIVGDRLFTIGTNKQLFAFDKKTGKVIWSHDLIKEFNSHELLIRPVVKTGYGCSPIAYRDTIICSVGGPGQSVMAFRQSDGAVAWKSGDF